MKTMLGLLFLVGSFLLPAGARAQSADLEPYLELLRSDVRTQKVALITEAMEFTTEDASKFWPIYREYETNMAKLGDERVAILKDFVIAYDTMDDVKAKALLDRSFKFEEQRRQLFKKTVDKVGKQMSPVAAARFFQVENQINRLIDLQIASQLPLIRHMAPKAAAPAPKTDGK